VLIPLLPDRNGERLAPRLRRKDLPPKVLAFIDAFEAAEWAASDLDPAHCHADSARRGPTIRAASLPERNAMRLKTRDIDPRKLLYFAMVVEQGSFRRAATKLGVSQPALCTSVTRLETDLGMKLVDRMPSGVQTTKFGDLLYQHSRVIRDEIFLAERNLRQMEDSADFPIRFGCLLSLTSHVVPKAIAQWRKSWPDHALRVAGGVQFDLLNALLRREIDMFVGFTEHYDLHDGLRQRVLFRDRLSVIARPGHPLFARPDLTLSDLANHPWVLVPPGPSAIGFEKVLEAAGVNLKVGTTVCDSIALLKSLVACSDHLGLIPFHAIETEVEIGLLDLLPVTIPEFGRSIAVFSREGQDLGEIRSDLVRCVQAVAQASQLHPRNRE
jgi:DNA-binding transcriptional LysR family regulator